jgi:hypothetical protein
MCPSENANAVRARDGAAVGSEESPQHPFKPTEAELQERHHEALVIMADWRDDILRKQHRLDLRAELIGGVEQDEVDLLKEEVEQFKRCSSAMIWQPSEVAP